MTSPSGIVGSSRAMRAVLERLPALAEASAPVLMSGETGCGKELFARALHYRSARRGKPFVPLNCGALPESLVENELFGHVRGAFTDASTSRDGLLGEADAGTLFLDEVDALPLGVQVKLLRVLQDGEYRRLGCTKTQRADVRVIAATNRDLRRCVDERRFRADLFYRLDVLRLALPPLRERPDDVPPLVDHFLKRFATAYGFRNLAITAAAVDRLVEHDWPGNVRELEAVLHRAVVLARGVIVDARHIDVAESSSTNGGAGTGGLRADAEVLHDFHTAKEAAIAAFERRYVTRLLAAHAGNVSRAAKSAGQDRRTLQRLIAKHAIDRRSFSA